MTRLFVFGASGTGATTLGRALAARLNVAHLDTDDVYWLRTDPPFERKRPAEPRLAMLATLLDEAGDWVLSGSLDPWGDPLIPRFGKAVFLRAPTALRIERLWARERALYVGDAEPGDPLYEKAKAFVDWAAAYDTGEREGRSLPRHEAWIAGLPCPVLRLDGDQPVDKLVEDVLANGDKSA